MLLLFAVFQEMKHKTMNSTVITAQSNSQLPKDEYPLCYSFSFTSIVGITHIAYFTNMV